MSYVALAIWFAFVAWFVRAERRQSGEKSFTSWIPTIWMLWSASRPVARWLDPHGDISEESGSGLDRMFLLALIGLSCLIISRRRLDWASRLRQNPLLVLLLIYMVVSCVWSDTAMSSFKQWVRVLGSAIIPLVVLTEAEPDRVLERVAMRTTYFLIPLSIILIKYFPEQGIDYRSWNGEKFWVGVCLHKNSLGRLCLVCGAFTFWTLIRRWKGREPTIFKYQNYFEFGILALIAWMLKGPETNYPVTSIGVLVLSAGALFGLLQLNRRVAERLFSALATFTVAVAIGLAFMSVSGIIPSLGNDSLGRDSTFTGRTHIWKGVREVAWQSPLLGVGYGGYWSKHHEFPEVGIVNEGHNGYLDVFVETGLIGVLLILMLLASFASRANQEKKHNYDLACMRLVFLLVLVLHNFTETSFLTSSGHLWALFMFLYMVFPERSNQSSVSESSFAQADEAIEQNQSVCSELGLSVQNRIIDSLWSGRPRFTRALGPRIFPVAAEPLK